MRPPRAVRRGYPGYTRDPWPCCGKAVESQRPKADGLCAECAALIADGRRLRDVMAEGDAVEYVWWSRDYAGPFMPGPQHREVVVAFDAVVRVVADVRPDVRPEWPGTPLVEPGRAVHEYSDFRCAARCTPAVRAALAALHKQIASAITAAEAQGRRRGSSILQALASGEVTVDKFNEGTGR